MVHYARSGQPLQPAPKVTLPVWLIVRVSPAGQVRVPRDLVKDEVVEGETTWNGGLERPWVDQRDMPGHGDRS